MNLYKALPLLYGALSATVFVFLHRVQPTAYMDETVHIPQAQKYYERNYEWDERLTTPPGLYVISLSVLIPISKIMGYPLVQTWHFRMCSLLCSIVSSYLLTRIIGILHKNVDVDRRAFSAFNVSLFPVLYFFSFFYYTESGSTMFVLLAYYLRLKGAETWAAFFGAISLSLRQTNIAWIFFMGCDKMTDTLNSYVIVKRNSEDESEDDIELLVRKIKTLALMPLKQSKLFFNMVAEIIHTCAPYIIVGLCFAAFVYCNEGVVVGDRRNHEVAFHIPQFLYFLGLLFVFASPIFVTADNVLNWLNCCCRRPQRVVCFFTVMASSLMWLHYDHHYLDDDRHLLVLLWKNLLKEGVRRYCFIPVYCFSGWMMWNKLKNRDVLWKFFLLLCAGFSVIFEGLFEIRYFILPYLFCRVHMNVESRIQLIVELILYSLINCIMFYLYASPPYEPNWYKSQRFFW